MFRKNACSLAAFIFALSTNLASAQTMLTLSSPDPEDSEISPAAHRFVDLVSEKTHGALIVQFFPDGKLFDRDTGKAIKQLSDGSLDILLLSASFYAPVAPRFTMVTVPYLFGDTTKLNTYLSGPVGLELFNDLDRIGIKGLSMWPRPFREMTSSSHPITRPSDLAGVKMRVPNSPLWVEFFKAMGAVPITMPFSQTSDALRQNIVDAQESPIRNAITAKFYETQSYMSITDHMADAWVLAINPAKYNTLTDDEKTALREAAAETDAWKVSDDDATATKSIALLGDKGMKVVQLDSEQHEAFAAVAKKLFPTFADIVTDKDFFARSVAAATKP